MAQWKQTRVVSMRIQVQSPGLAQWVKDLVLLWLWCRSSATAPIRPLAWEPPGKKKKRVKSPYHVRQHPLLVLLSPFKLFLLQFLG